jgi:hypothetical protein
LLEHKCRRTKTVKKLAAQDANRDWEELKRGATLHLHHMTKARFRQKKLLLYESNNNWLGPCGLFVPSSQLFFQLQEQSANFLTDF